MEKVIGFSKKRLKKKLSLRRFEGHHLGGCIRHILKVIPGSIEVKQVLDKYKNI